MMLIQVANMEHLWESYGEAMGVPLDVLAEVSRMKGGNHDKMVEVMDDWFFNHPRNPTPTWREIATGLKDIGCGKPAEDIMEVYNTGESILFDSHMSLLALCQGVRKAVEVILLSPVCVCVYIYMYVCILAEVSVFAQHFWLDMFGIKNVCWKICVVLVMYLCASVFECSDVYYHNKCLVPVHS